ncbi:cyclin-T1 isoform X1 [Hydra vulgaris]|nr:cyclin-T1 [Hydra vulgaris]
MANQTDRWYFTKEDLRNTPSVRDGIEFAKELGYRQQCANLVQDIGQRLQVNQLVINTAIVYMHRFYMFHSFQSMHRNAMAPCFVFLAAKVEDQPRKLEHVLKVSHMCLHKDKLPLDTKSDDYMQLSAELVNNESILLQTLGFEVSIDHPNTYVVKCAQLVKATKDLAQTAYFLATNSLHLTTFCIQYKPTVVACVCIYVSCLWASYVIPETEGKNWFEFIENTTTKKQLEDLSSYFIKILDSSPTRLKKRLTSGGAVVYKDGKVMPKKLEETDSTVAKATVNNSKSDTNKHGLNSGLFPKSNLTSHLKPHSHEATPPPNRTLSLHQSSKLLKANPKSEAEDKVQNLLHAQNGSKSIVEKGTQINFELLKQKMTPEQWEDYKKKMTPEQIESYKKWKIRERQLYLKRKASGASIARDANINSHNKLDIKPGLVRKHSIPNEIRESPVKKQKLSSDHNQVLLNNHEIQKVPVKLNSEQTKKYEVTKHFSNNQQTLHVNTNHNRLNSKPDNLSDKSPPPPPPPPISSTVIPTPVTTMLSTPTKSNQHKNRVIGDNRLQHLSPPPPPPVLKFSTQ